MRQTRSFSAKSGQTVVAVYQKLSAEYAAHPDKAPSAKLHSHAYTSLIGVMLSAQSQDARTAVACRQLFALARTPEDMVRLPQPEVVAAIRPAGLFNTKSKNILAASKMLIEKFGSCVPRTHGALMALPGVGRKSADIVMRFVWGEPHIAVDTHVFRLLWRLGWLRSLDEGKASIEVNAITPDEFKHGAHMWLITHAKAVCRSRKPLCDSCILRDQCERRDVEIPKNKLRALYRGDYQRDSTARSAQGGESGDSTE
jgi:endonuclease-3